jgi:hypothetical protein
MVCCWERGQDDAEGSSRRSAQAIVPLIPYGQTSFPNTLCSPADNPTFHPNPRGVTPGGLWFRTMSFAVSGFRQAPVSFRKSARNFPRSGAEA